jgi:hypothetical protein
LDDRRDTGTVRGTRFRAAALTKRWRPTNGLSIGGVSAFRERAAVPEDGDSEKSYSGSVDIAWHDDVPSAARCLNARRLSGIHAGVMGPYPGPGARIWSPCAGVHA